MGIKLSVYALVTVVLLALSAAPAVAEGELCSFTVAGILEAVDCYELPEPPGPPEEFCLLEIEIPRGAASTLLTVVCSDAMVEVCEVLQEGWSLLVLGDDDGANKEASHVGLWLQPPPTKWD